MDPQHEHLEQLRDIRSMMERSSRFISLSGLTGIIAGLAALVGVGVAYKHLGIALTQADYYQFLKSPDGNNATSFIILDFASVLGVSLLSSLLLTKRKAKEHGQAAWDATAQRLFFNIMIPLAVGGIYALILLYQGQLAFIAPVTLLFYGLALINASKYTLQEVRWLGIAQICTGLVAAFFMGYGLLFWAFGFGVLHVLYGLGMYLKYER